MKRGILAFIALLMMAAFASCSFRPSDSERKRIVEHAEKGNLEAMIVAYNLYTYHHDTLLLTPEQSVELKEKMVKAGFTNTNIDIPNEWGGFIKRFTWGLAQFDMWFFQTSVSIIETRSVWLGLLMLIFGIGFFFLLIYVFHQYLKGEAVIYNYYWLCRNKKKHLYASTYEKERSKYDIVIFPERKADLGSYSFSEFFPINSLALPMVASTIYGLFVAISIVMLDHQLGLNIGCFFINPASYGTDMQVLATWIWLITTICLVILGVKRHPEVNWIKELFIIVPSIVFGYIVGVTFSFLVLLPIVYLVFKFAISIASDGGSSSSSSRRKISDGTILRHVNGDRWEEVNGVPYKKWKEDPWTGNFHPED